MHVCVQPLAEGGFCNQLLTLLQCHERQQASGMGHNKGVLHHYNFHEDDSQADKNSKDCEVKIHDAKVKSLFGVGMLTATQGGGVTELVVVKEKPEPTGPSKKGALEKIHAHIK